MSKIWEDIRKSIKDLGKEAATKTGEFTKIARDKAEEVTKIGKVKLEILQIKRDIDRYYSELGG
jgi:hypothetical protein